jgi:hypothetical protein
VLLMIFLFLLPPLAVTLMHVRTCAGPSFYFELHIFSSSQLNRVMPPRRLT